MSQSKERNVLADVRIQARKIADNRLVGLSPGEETGWDIESEFNPETNGWADRVHSNIPRIEEDEMIILRRLERRLNNHPKTDEFKSDEGFRTGGDQVLNEAEEMGEVGPSEWQRDKVNKMKRIG
jgi:hypothetical protein